MAGGPTRGRTGGDGGRPGRRPGERRPGDGEPAEERGRVIPFVPRPRPRDVARPAVRDMPRPDPRRPVPPPTDHAVPDLTRYERDDEPDDFGHRMLANVAAFVVVALLIAGGLWIASVMADQRKSQDCVLSGRPGCTPVPLPKGPPGP